MIRLLSTVLLCSVALGSANAQSPYDSAPFAVQAIDPAHAVVEPLVINNWLRENVTRISEGQVQGAREHLHALIDAHVKQSFAKANAFLPPQPGGLLPVLYSWAGRLGVYGGDLIYEAVKGDYPVKPPPGPVLPVGYELSLKGQSLVLESTAGSWRVEMPFHFFIFAIRDGVAVGGQRTEMTVISTGSAPDAAPPGFSQATIALVFVHGATTSDVEREWAKRMQIPLETEQVAVGATQFRSRVAFDSATRLHKELVMVPSEKGAFAIFYSGLDGTYQANRPHFVDILRMASFPK